MSFDNFKNINQLGLEKRGLKIDLSSMRAVLEIDLAFRNKDYNFSQLLNCLPELKENFEVAFLIQRNNFNKYINSCVEREAIKKRLLKLSCEHEFYFSIEPIMSPSMPFNMKNEIEKSIYKFNRDRRQKNYIEKLFISHTARLNNKNDEPANIDLSYRFAQVVKYYHFYSTKTKNELLTKGYFKNENSGKKNYFTSWNSTEVNSLSKTQFIYNVVQAGRINIEAVEFCEKLGFIIEPCKVYENMKALGIFSTLDQDETKQLELKAAAYA